MLIYIKPDAARRHVGPPWVNFDADLFAPCPWGLTHIEVLQGKTGPGSCYWFDGLLRPVGKGCRQFLLMG